METLNHQDEISPVAPPLPSEAAVKPPAWEMIENGRYRPRRIRGSFLGRELG